MPSPGHLKIAGVTTSLKHTQEHLQAIQVIIDHILVLSTHLRVLVLGWLLRE